MYLERQVDGIHVIRLVTPPLQSNTYIIFTDNNEGAVVIDANGSILNIERVLEQNNKTLKAVLLTHGHFDHAGAASALQKKGAKIYIHKADADKLYGKGNLAELAFGFPFATLKADAELEDKDIVKECGLEFEVIHTPGHSQGSVCYKLHNMLFTGDTLMKNTFGATDFPDGSLQQIRSSICNILFTLPDEYILFCGHGEDSLLSKEKIGNPIYTYALR